VRLNPLNGIANFVLAGFTYDMKSKFSPLVLTLVFGTIITCGVLIENAQAYQPHMQNALESLRSARHQLEIAEHDKGGHRDNAIADIDAAIGEVKAGMAFAN
jgi:hypothetical protein